MLIQQQSRSTITIERTKISGNRDVERTLKLAQLSGTTVEVERAKFKIDLVQALKLCQLSCTTVELKKTKCKVDLAHGPYDVSTAMYQCGGGEEQV
jgi:hypothetical protein